MHLRAAAYWTTTTIVALSFLSGGAAYLRRLGDESPAWARRSAYVSP